MLSLFVSVDNSLTQKEIDPSMQEERKLLDAIPAILKNLTEWMNEWVNKSVLHITQNTTVKNTPNRL